MELASGAARASTVAFISEEYYTYMYKGIVLYFYALRSGHYAYTFAGNALSCNGDSDGGGVASWFAVRPAHELTC